MKQMLLVLSLAALAVALGAAARANAAGTSDATQVVVQRGQPVEIAFANDLTGQASSFSVSLANAVNMAVEAHPAIRGFPIQINVVDTPCGDPAADVAVATSIVSNRQTVGVLGQLCSFGFDQALPVYEMGGVVTITGSATNDTLPLFAPTVFNRTAVDDGDDFNTWYAAISLLPRNLAWRQAYALEFGSSPMDFADLYYDAASLLIKDLQRVSSIEDGNLVIGRAALAQAVRNTTKYQGVTCTITLDPATGNRVNDAAAVSGCSA
jgi:ABC-type branched-subunit amino acid transport system substrate-binding protein